LKQVTSSDQITQPNQIVSFNDISNTTTAENSYSDTELLVESDPVQILKPIVKKVRELVEALVVTLSRKELYEKIWEKSVAGVAKEYDIPYTQLMKQVKAANIPYPPSGYWTKLSCGKPVEKIPLNAPIDEMISLHKTITTIIFREVTPEPVASKTKLAKQKTILKKPSDVKETHAEIEPEYSQEEQEAEERRKEEEAPKKPWEW